jgi:hypothetical protein
MIDPTVRNTADVLCHDFSLHFNLPEKVVRRSSDVAF